MGMLWQRALEEAEQIGNKELREARKKEIEMAYREPALRHLKTSSSARAEAPAYMEGLIARYEKRYEDALMKARQAIVQVPWLYEARKPEGDQSPALENERNDVTGEAQTLD